MNEPNGFATSTSWVDPAKQQNYSDPAPPPRPAATVVASVDDLLAARAIGAGETQVTVDARIYERVTQKYVGGAVGWEDMSREPVIVLAFVAQGIVILRQDGIVDQHPYGIRELPLRSTGAYKSEHTLIRAVK